MKIIIKIIKKLVCSLCMLYGLNMLIETTNLIIPINCYSIFIVSLFDIPGILMLILLKHILF